MKKIGLKDNEDDIILSIQNNLANRNENIKAFLTMLENIEENYVIAIDGDWGSGKTFFVKQLMKIIDYKQDKLSNHKISKIKKSSFLEDIQLKQSYTTLYYNAWDYDDTDPMLSLLYCLCGNENYEKSKDALTNILKLANCLPIPLIGGKINEITDVFTKENITEVVDKNNKLRDYITNLLVDILSANDTQKIVIFIDELDRCNPVFSVKLLERIKHIFTDDRFIFVFSTTLTQLSSTLSVYYGQNFNSYVYLEKMFDSIVNLNIANTTDYFEYNNVNSNKLVYRIAIEYSEKYSLSLRQCNKYIEQLEKIEQKLSIYSNSNIFLIPLTALLLGVKQNDIWTYSNLVNGTGIDEFVNIINRLQLFKNTIDIKIHYINKSYALNDGAYRELYSYLFINQTQIWFGREFYCDMHSLSKILTLL